MFVWPSIGLELCFLAVEAFIPIWFHASYLGELNLQSHWLLDWQIPSAFGALVPNIANKQFQMNANWMLYIALIVLCERFKWPQYYQHFMQLAELLKLCVAFEISEAMLNRFPVVGGGIQKVSMSRFPVMYHTQIDIGCTTNIFPPSFPPVSWPFMVFFIFYRVLR